MTVPAGRPLKQANQHLICTQTHFLAQNHSFDLGNKDAEEEEHRIVQRL